jgi:phosphatidylglycerophosphate synthase
VPIQSMVQGYLANEDSRVRFYGPFASASLEKAFRDDQSADDQTLARACVLVTIVGACLFPFSDYRLTGPGSLFLTLLAVRGAFFVFSVATWFGLRRLRAAAADRLLLAWSFAVCGQHLFVSATRPPTFTGHFIVGVILVLLTYCVLPLLLNWQAIPALLVSAIGIGLAVFGNGAGITTTSVVGAYILANLIGAATSRRLHQRRRQVFVSSLREAAMRAQLEQALAEVRTLRGLLSICAWCKRVRIQEEVWQQVELYVEDHTHAKFTHSICPGCLDKQLAESDASSCGMA